MDSASTIMIPFETWSGIVGIFFITILSINFIRQKITLKQTVLNVIIFASIMIFFYFNSKDIDVVTNFYVLIQKISSHIDYKYFVPFCWLIPDILNITKSYYISTLLCQYVSTFVFSIVFAFLFSLRYSRCSTRRFIIITTIMFLVFEAIIFLESLIGGTGILFDTGNWLLIAIGLFCGRTFGKYALGKRVCENDNS